MHSLFAIADIPAGKFFNVFNRSIVLHLYIYHVASFYQYECPAVYDIYSDLYDGIDLRTDLSDEI